MAGMSMAARSGLAAARTLRGLMQGKVVLPGEDAYLAVIQGRIVLPSEDAYNRARRIWNGAVNHYPALFAQCETVQDVQAAIRIARAHQLPLSVRAGGYDWTGRALCHGGMVLDLSRMRAISVDAQSRVATVCGGATASDLAAAAAPHGLAAVTGVIGEGGMAGLTLGGGYGPLCGCFGLALDNLLGAEMVLADGRRVTADDGDNADLFWALRGGGGNFGVVTGMRLRLHPLGKVLTGSIAFPWSEAEPILSRYAEIAATAPDELTVAAALLSGPDDRPMLILAPTWCGAPAEGEQAIAALQELGTPSFVRIAPATAGAMHGLLDGHLSQGRHYAIETRWLPELTPVSISALAAGGCARTSALSVLAIHPFHGAATRVAPEATAFGLRRGHFLVEIIACWEPAIGEAGTAHRQWARALSEALAPAALPGGHPSLLAPDNHEQIAFAYGGNAARLQYLKRRFDPDGVFASAIALPARRARVGVGMAAR
ncbi:MAG TPA: FAD-binding oxidoreductase [Stellaceae bacterium]|nr:FAD-binding oxidoreductase [Stellaceae bacterium]